MRPRAFIALILLSAPVAAQQPAPAAPLNGNLERMTNGSYTRSHDYHIVHQRISVSDFDWDSTSFAGSVATTLVALRPGLDSIVLDAGPLLAIRSVTTASGAALRHSGYRDTLVVHLARPVAFHDTVQFTIAYAGRVHSGSGLTFIDERPHTPRQIWSMGESRDNHYWFPTYDFPNDKMTWEVEATIPAGYSAISNGSLVGDTRAAGNAHTMHWSQDTPSASYLVSLVVAPLAKVHDDWHGVPVDYYVYHQDSALAYRLFHITPGIIDVYSSLTGVPYPWEKYAQTTVADFFGGMENVSATTLVDWLPDARAYLDRPWYQHLLIPHELAHQWFGDYVTLENWANMWLNEGFAEFMAGQYWARTLGAHDEEDYYADEYSQFERIDHNRRMPLASLGSNNIYPKGALVIEMLKQYLGPDRFWAGVHRYLTSHALGNATSEDLRQAFLEATGENLDWFWNEWVYSAGYPDFMVTTSYDAAASRFTIHVNQTQRDTLRADSTGLRYVVPETFRMPVTIRVGTEQGDITRTVWIRQRSETILIDSVPSAPAMFIFDDGNRILKTLTLDEPTEWLANQLHRDPNLWNRGWAISQLSKRRADPAAAAALSWAATNADYPSTRAEATESLAAFPRDVALPAIERSFADTSAQVRVAAMGALGDLGGQRAIELSRAAWRADSSYEVRAGALDALIWLDAANRRSLIAEGLGTASYRDAIQDVALSAVARLGDTDFIEPVQQLAGDNELAVTVLVSLAAHGQHALDLLISDLDDDRRWVRQWAATAASRLDAHVKNEAITGLQSALPKLRHPDAKAAVARLIDQLQHR